MTVVRVTVVIVIVVKVVKIFKKRQLDTLTTDAMFKEQRFAILAMFFFLKIWLP